MPPLPPAARIVKVSLRGTSGSVTPWQNGFHLQYTGTAPTVANLDTLALTIMSLYDANYGPLMPGTNTLTEGVLTDLTNITAAVGSAQASMAGTRVGVSYPASVACVVSWKINTRYRGGHPRTYLPVGVTTDSFNPSHWTQAFVDAVEAASIAFRTGMNALTTTGATYIMVSLNYWTYGMHPPTLRPVPVPYTISDNVVKHRIDTQRRRLGKETV